PLSNFSISVTDPVTSGVALLKNQHLTVKEPPFDVGTLVLDDTTITVVLIAPADGTTAVALNTPVTIVLSDPISSTWGISVNDGTSVIAYPTSISADGKTVTFSNAWPQSKDLSVVVATFLSDVYGRHPNQTVVSHFFTVDT